MRRSLSFGVFDLDITTGELRKHGVRVRLSKQSIEVLRLLAEKPGELVSRDEIQRKLWPDGVVVGYEHSINTAVGRLREALGESASTPHLIETIPGRGYRLLVQVQTLGTENPSAKPLVADAARAKQATRRRRLLYGAAISVLLGLSFVMTGRPSLPKSAAFGRVRSIAVMPVLNVSGDPTQEYLADWMTERLISTLGSFGTLRVTSHTTAKTYKGSHKTVPEIGRELGVDAVLEGSVETSGGMVRTAARLIHARTDKQLWSGSFERESREVMIVQSDIARAIVTGIRISVTPQELAHLTLRRPVRWEALEAYLKGRHNLELAGGSDHGVKFFREAVRLDPAFALGWATLAQQQLGLLQAEDLPADQEVLSAARRAMELDDSLAEAHSVVGDIAFHSDWDWPRGEAEYRRALELNPASVDAQVHFGVAMMALGRTDAGLKAMRRALELEPQSPVINAAYGHWLRLSGQPQRALQQLEHSIDIGPTYADNHLFLARVYEDLGEDQLALEAWMKAATRNSQPFETIQAWKDQFRVAGMAGVRRYVGAAQLKLLRERAKRSRVSPTAFARAYSLMGEKAEAFGWLDKAYEARCPQLVSLRLDPVWDPLRSEPAFVDLLNRMKLR